ncbi:MAG: SGNH hydrolase domain-containing protein [Solirubrobacterales bacterium]
MTLAAMLLGTIAVSAVAGGATDRFVPSFARVQSDKGAIFRDGCLILGNEANSGPCVYGEPKSRKVVFVFGDSHALHWTPALLKIADRRGWRLIALLRADCTSALVNTDPICNRWRRNSLTRITRVKPSLVILGTNTGKKVLVRDETGSTLNRQASDRVLQAGMATTMKKMLRTGSKVTLMRDLVLAPFPPSSCVRKNPGNPNRCSFRAFRPLWRSFDYKAARRFKRVQIIDPLSKVCPRRRCSATYGRYLKFRDRSHLSATYAATLSGWLGRRIQNP